MKKILASLLLILIILFSFASSYAEDAEAKDFSFRLLANGKCCTTVFKGDSVAISMLLESNKYEHFKIFSMQFCVNNGNTLLDYSNSVIQSKEYNTFDVSLNGWQIFCDISIESFDNYDEINESSIEIFSVTSSAVTAGAVNITMYTNGGKSLPKVYLISDGSTKYTQCQCDYTDATINIIDPEEKVYIFNSIELDGKSNLEIRNKKKESVKISAISFVQYNEQNKMISYSVLNSDNITLAAETGEYIFDTPALSSDAAYGKIYITDSNYCPVADTYVISN